MRHHGLVLATTSTKHNLIRRLDDGRNGFDVSVGNLDLPTLPLPAFYPVFCTDVPYREPIERVAVTGQIQAAALSRFRQLV